MQEICGVSVSVIIPTYNRAHTILKSIESVQSQTFTNWELLVVDDGSDDETRQLILKKAEMDSRIKYKSNYRCKGQSGARNCGIIESVGKYVAFLDSDDVWMCHHLSDSVDVLERSHLSICTSLWFESIAGNIRKYSETEGWESAFTSAVKMLKPRVIGNAYFFSDEYFEYNIFHPLHCYHINSTVLNRELLKKVGLFNEDLHIGEDNEFLMRVFYGNRFCFLNDFHFIYFDGADNIYNYINHNDLNWDEIMRDYSLKCRLAKTVNSEISALMSIYRFISEDVELKDKRNALELYKEKIDKRSKLLNDLEEGT